MYSGGYIQRKRLLSLVSVVTETAVGHPGVYFPGYIQREKIPIKEREVFHDGNKESFEV